MKKFFLFSAVALATSAVMVSCSSDDCTECQEVVVNNDAISKVGIRPVIDNGQASRASEKTAWVSGDKIGVFVTKPTSVTTPFQTGSSNLAYTFTAGTGWSNATSYTIGAEYPKVFAYYPHNAANTNLKAVPVDKSVDFMVGIGTGPTFRNNSADYDIPMKHALTQFVFVMKKGAGYTGAGTVSKLEISRTSGNVLFNAGTVDLETQAFTGSSPVEKWAYTPNVAVSTAGTAYGDMVMPVSAGTGVLKLLVTIDGRNYTYTFGAVNWTAGKRHKYEFSLSETGMTIGGDGTGVTIEPWADDSTGTINLTPAN